MSDYVQYKWIWGCTRHTMPPNRGPVWQAVQYSVSCDNLVVQSRVTVHSTSEFEVVLGIQCPLIEDQFGKPYRILWVATTLLCRHEFIKVLHPYCKEHGRYNQNSWALFQILCRLLDFIDHIFKSWFHVRNSPTHLSYASPDTTYTSSCRVIKPALNFSPVFWIEKSFNKFGAVVILLIYNNNYLSLPQVKPLRWCEHVWHVLHPASFGSLPLGRVEQSCHHCLVLLGRFFCNIKD